MPFNIHLFLHDRAGASASLLYNAEKPSVRPSVRLRHGIISVVSAWIHLGLGLCIAESFETVADLGGTRGAVAPLPEISGSTKE